MTTLKFTGVVYFGVLSYYTLLWTLDYYGVIPNNHLDGNIASFIEWLNGLERLDLVGFPIRLGRLVFLNMPDGEQLGMNQAVYVAFVTLVAYPLIWSGFYYLGYPMLLLVPLLSLLYRIDRDLFLEYPSRNPDDYVNDVFSKLDY